MVLTADQLRVKSLLTETITLLCKNGLHFQTEFSIEGLIGITLDSQDVFLVSIKETVSAPDQPAKQSNNEDSISQRKLGSVNFISQQTRRPKMFEISGANKRRPFVGYRQPIDSAYANSKSRNVKQNWSSAQNTHEQFNAETAAETLSDSSRYVNDVKWESSSNHQHNKERTSSEQEDSSDKVAVASHSLDNDNVQSYTTKRNNDTTNERSNEGASGKSMQQESLRKRRRLSDTVRTDLVEIDSSANLADGIDEIGDSGDEQNVVEHDKNASNQKYCDVSEQPTEDSYNSDGPVSDFLKIKEEVVNDDVDSKSASRFDDYMTYLAICGVQTDTQNYQALASSTASGSLSFHTTSASTSSIGERGRTNWSSVSRSNERGRSTFTSNSDGTPPTSSQTTASGNSYNSRDQTNRKTTEQSPNRERLSYESCQESMKIKPGVVYNWEMPKSVARIVTHAEDSTFDSQGEAIPYRSVGGRYTCPYCGRIFSASNNLRGHLVSHTGVKEFTCKLCSKQFAYKHRLKKHFERCVTLSCNAGQEFRT